LGQHFLLSAKARTLSVVEIARMSEDEARAAFRVVRFAGNGGEPFCPHCGVDAVYEFKKRRIFKCKACEKQFSLTSGTLFAHKKLYYRDILTAIALFVNGANGYPALRFGRDLDVSYKTAWVLLHKLREVMGALQAGQKLSGLVEVDGVYVGGHVRPTNPFERHQRSPPKRAYSAKRRSIVTIRERRRGGRTLSFVARSEGEAAKSILAHTEKSAVLHTDMEPGWGLLMRYRKVEQVNHSKQHVRRQENGPPIHINHVESFNGRVRSAERGVHHRISGRYLQSYADEMGWRVDHRHVDNGRQFGLILGRAAALPTSKDWKGYWQRRRGDGPRPEFTRLVREQDRKAA
jgi:transposase-like protein